MATKTKPPAVPAGKSLAQDDSAPGIPQVGGVNQGANSTAASNVLSPGIKIPDPGLDATLGYIGGPFLNATSPYLNQLPYADDDLDLVLGMGTYRRMGYDAQVHSSELLLKAIALHTRPEPVGAYLDDSQGTAKYDKSQRVLEFWHDSFNNLERNGGSLYHSCMANLSNAMAYGHGLSEITWEWGAGKHRERKLLKSIQTRDRRGYAFIVDAYWNRLGEATYVGPYQEWINAATKLLHDGTYIVAGELNKTLTTPAPNQDKQWVWGWEMIRRAENKTWVLTLLGENEDPRGASWRRSVYAPWLLKQKLLVYMALYAQRFAVPSLFGTSAENAPEQFPLNAQGFPDTTQPAVPATVPLLQSMRKIQSGGSAVAPFGSKVDVLNAASDSGLLMQLLGWCDGQINQGITGQSLANRTSPHQAKAAGEVHQDTLNNPPFYLKHQLEDSFYWDILLPGTVENFGPEYAEFAPRLSTGRVTAEDFVPMLRGIGEAMRDGALHWSMLPRLWEWFGFPPVDLTAFMAELKQEKELLAAAQQGPQAGSDSLLAKAARTQDTNAIARVNARQAQGRLGATFGDEG